MSVIFNKMTKLSLNAVNPAASLTLMSADIERIVTGWQTMHEIWANIIEIALAIYLLERQLGAACAVPLAVSIGTLSNPIVQLGLVMTTLENSFINWILVCHYPSHVSSGYVARSDRKAHQCYNFYAWIDEECEDVRFD